MEPTLSSRNILRYAREAVETALSIEGGRYITIGNSAGQLELNTVQRVEVRRDMEFLLAFSPTKEDRDFIDGQQWHSVDDVAATYRARARKLI